MENNITNPQTSSLDFVAIIKKLWHSKRLLIVNCLVAALLAGIWIIPRPRTYQASVSMAPETESGPSAMGNISSLASSFGVNLGGMTSADAFYPQLYPDIVASNRFLIGLLGVNVETADGSYKGTYYDYMTKHQKTCFWDAPKRWVKNLTNAVSGNKPGKPGSLETMDAFCLTERETKLLEKMRNDIICSADKKTDVISISVTAQDPKVCAIMADSVRAHLQTFMTDYRTAKARKDMEYYEGLMLDAKGNYDAAVKEYSAFCDTHTDLMLQSYITKRDELENEMQRCYTAYSAYNTQYEASKAKVQESTPAFTLLEGATMPVKPSGPKRMLFMLGMMILTFLGTSGWVLRRDIFKK